MKIKKGILAVSVSLMALGLVGCSTKKEAAPQVVKERCYVSGIGVGYSISGSSLELQYKDAQSASYLKTVRTPTATKPSAIESIIKAEDVFREQARKANKDLLYIGHVEDTLKFVQGFDSAGHAYKIDF